MDKLEVKVVGEPVLYDIRGIQLHLEDTVAVPYTSRELKLGIITSLGKSKVVAKFECSINGKTYLKKICINSDKVIKY